MTIQRMDNVGIVAGDMDAAIAFFTELGLELEGEAQAEGPWADRTVGLDGVRCDIAMLRTPDGRGRLELAKYLAPAAVSAGQQHQPHNTLGMHRVMFAVDDIDTLSRSHPLRPSNPARCLVINETAPGPAPHGLIGPCRRAFPAAPGGAP